MTITIDENIEKVIKRSALGNFIENSKIIGIELTDIVSSNCRIDIEKDGIKWSIGCLFHNILQDARKSFISYFQTIDEVSEKFSSYKREVRI